MPWTREDLGEETDHSMKEISEEEALFLSKLQMIGISFELSLAILSEMRRTGGDIPKEKYESWGFADAFSMGYVELQYQLTQEGMTVEQVDYLESNASLLAALDLALYNIAAAGIKIAGSGVLSEKLSSFNKTSNRYNEAKNANWKKPDGSTWWPDNDGFLESPIMTTLQPGTKIDRYGNVTGKFAAPEGTPFQNRSLAPGSEKSPYNIYEVIKPFDVLSGIVAPWFDQPGGGIQYYLPMSIQELIDLGFIK